MIFDYQDWTMWTTKRDKKMNIIEKIEALEHEPKECEVDDQQRRDKQAINDVLDILKSEHETYYYNIGYTSYEDSHYEILVHEQKFTQAELEDMIWEGIQDILSQDKEENYDNVADLYFGEINIYSWLKTHKGFQELEITASSVTWGWYNFQKAGWDNEIKEMPLMEKISAFVKSEVRNVDAGI